MMSKPRSGTEGAPAGQSWGKMSIKTDNESDKY